MSSRLNLQNKRFLVIGSNSFSGSHFVNGLINSSCNVVGISRSSQPNVEFLPYLWSKSENEKENLSDGNLFNFYQYNLNTQLKEIMNVIDDFQPSYIVNFAAQGMVAQSWLNPTHWYKTNVVSQVALHDELRKKKFIKKYVHVTTPEVYGSTDLGWIKENYNFAPSTPYAVSRAACDLHLLSFFKAYDFPVVFTRAANVYGPGQQLYRIIPRTLLSALTNQKMELHGAGISERSFIYIKDVVDATIQIAIDAEPGTTWHISTKEALSIRNLVENIISQVGSDFDQIVEVGKERLGKDQNYLLDSSKLRQKFNWKENYTLKEGISLTMDWVRSNLILFEKLPWSYQHKL